MLTLAEMRETTGMVVPVWYPDDMDADQMASVLRPCLVDVAPFARRENVVVVVDGSDKTRKAVLRVQKALGNFEILYRERNEGKGGAVRSGIDRLLKNPAVRYIVTRDHDNDHLANDALNLVNLADRMRRQCASELALSIGRRVSVHRHLGFMRGEHEWFMNEVCFEAAKFALAREGRTVNTQYFAAYELVPDMQTGFKCYTRKTAALLLRALQASSSVTPGLDVVRHGAEIPVILETLLAGGTVGEVTRSSWESQPFSTYDLAGRVQVKGTVLTWALRRAGVPAAVARQLILNALPRRVLSKDAKGLADLLALANWTLNRLGACTGQTIEPIERVGLAEYF